MAWTLIAHTNAANTGTSPAIDTTGSDLILVGYAGFDPGANPLSDSKTNTWVQAAKESASDTAVLFYCHNPTVGTGHTFSIGPNASSFVVAAYSGSIASGVPLDASTTGAGTAGNTTQQAGSITPTVNGELIVMLIGVNDPADTGTPKFSFDSGLSVVDFVDVAPGSFWGTCLGAGTQATAGAINPTWTRSNPASGSDALILASFKPVAAAGPSVLFRRSLSPIGGRTGARQIQR